MATVTLSPFPGAAITAQRPDAIACIKASITGGARLRELLPWNFDSASNCSQGGPLAYSTPGRACARRTGCGSPNALALRRARGKAPRFHRIGRRILYRGVDLNRFLEACAVEPTNGRAGPVLPASVSEGSTAGGLAPASAGAA